MAWGAIFGILAVILGALGAHALKEHLAPSALESYRTGVAYQMYHALFLLFLGSTRSLEERAKKIVFYLVLAGVFCFSFSIYGLTIGPLAGMDFSTFGWITPVGGLLLISGWVLILHRILTGLN